MKIRCPHCQNGLNVEDPSTIKEVLCPACGSTFRLAPDSTAAWSPQEGQRKLGKFELLDAVGFGAFGTVFKARDPELDRIVAIKVPRAGSLATREDLNRFLREARSAAHLRHPSIIPIYEVGQCDSIPYLVSEFVQGMTLADLLTARRLAPDKAAALVADLADALQYAHDQKVVHRDVKPSNILIDNDNRPHLMDFGLAKRDAGEVTMTLDGQVLGTPAYMSPEQAAGEAHQVDGRSDLYSLGTILYQLLTGELPFKGNARALIHQVQHDDPPAPRQWNKDLPRDLETICLKAMAKDREKRYATAATLADDLRRYLRGEPILARRPGQIERTIRWCKRRRGVLAGVVGAVGLSLIVGVAVYLSRPPAKNSDGETTSTLVTTGAGNGTANSEDKKLPPLPADLALVPPDGFAFVSVRLADLLEQAGVKRLVQTFTKYPKVFPGVDHWEADFQKALIHKPGSVERWTAIPLHVTSPDRITILSTTQPFGRETVSRWLGAGAQTKGEQGQEYQISAGPPIKATRIVNDRIQLFGSSETAIKNFLAHKPAAASPPGWQSTLDLAAKRYQGLVGVNFQPTMDWKFIQMFLQNMPGGPAFTSRMDALKQAQAAFLLFNLRSGTLSGDRLELRLRLVFADAQRSQKAALEIRQLVARVQPPLQQIVQSLAKDPNTLIKMGGPTGMPREAVKWTFQVFEQFTLGLQDIDIKADGNLVDVRMPYLAIDLAGFGTLIAESSKAEEAKAENVLEGPNLVRLGLALQDYIADQKHLPPAALVSADGRPLLSWRVALLPYLGHKELYQQFKLDQAWDSPHNKTLLKRMPSVYGTVDPKTASFMTYYRAVVGPGTAFENTPARPRAASADGPPPTRTAVPPPPAPVGPLAASTDGPTQTIALIHAPTAVEWTKPDEVAYLPNKPVPPLGGLAIFADGLVRRLDPKLDDATRRALLTRNDGEKVAADKLPPLPNSVAAPGLNDQSWRIVRQPGARPERYRYALRLAEAACRLTPHDGLMLNTLGVAQYRLGRYQDALTTLTQSDKLSTAKLHGSLVADLSFLAMCHHQLGHKEQAQDYLRRLREKMKNPAEAKNQENQSFLHETERAVSSRPASGK